MKKIVFIGGGHSNTLAIRLLMQKIVLNNQNSQFNKIFSKYSFHLISEYSTSAYSGMIPGTICGYYTKDDSYIDLVKFSKIHNLNFIQKKVNKINPLKNLLTFENDNDKDKDNVITKDDINNNTNNHFYYDFLAINIGSKTLNSRHIPGVEKYSIQTRPINQLIKKLEISEIDLKEKLKNKNEIRLGIVGSGIAGIELGFCIKSRFKTSLPDKECHVEIFSNLNNIIPDVESNVVEDLVKIADSRNIKFIRNSECVEITNKGVKYINKTQDKAQDNVQVLNKDFDLVVWATGAGPQDLNINCNLDLDKRGFILVKETLQSITYDNIFSAGDCIQLDRYKSNNNCYPPKSGVYAVREAAILAENLYKIIAQDDYDQSLDLDLDLDLYTPQPNFLKLITLGDKLAFGTKFGISFYGKWVWNLKEHIDVNFVNMFYQDLICNQNLKNNTTTDTQDKNEIEIENENVDFNYENADQCIDKLINSKMDEDFRIQLKIIEKLAVDDVLLKKIKNKLKI